MTRRAHIDGGSGGIIGREGSSGLSAGTGFAGRAGLRVRFFGVGRRFMRFLLLGDVPTRASAGVHYWCEAPERDQPLARLSPLSSIRTPETTLRYGFGMTPMRARPSRLPASEA